MGDLDLETKERLGDQKITELEHEAVTSSLEGMPKKLQTKYEKMFREYQNQSTPEAQLVKQIDYVEMLLQAREYSEVEEDKDLKEFWKDWKNHTYDEDVRLLLQNLLKDFH
jgi:putative hydrolase of HD superfamily